jgi:hypothetical protein
VSRCQNRLMVTTEVEYQLLGGVLDGLDDLYDERERAELWLARLLTATSVALTGTAWERPMADAAAGVTAIAFGEGRDTQKNRQALGVTDELRVKVAARWAELDSTEST